MISFRYLFGWDTIYGMSRKNSRVARTAKPASPQQVPGSKRRTAVVGGVVLVLLVLVAYLQGGFALWPLQNARSAMDRRDHASAIEALQLAEFCNGDQVSIDLLRARISLRRGDLAETELQLRRAQQHGAKSRDIEREKLLAAALNGELEKIEPELKAWLESPGTDGADICDAYTHGLASQGRLEEAQLLLEAWQTGFPEDPKPHVKRARIGEYALQQDAAEEEYRRALAKQPSYAPAIYSLARLLLERKRPEEALELFQLCHKVSPDTAAAAQIGEARSLVMLGNSDDAREILQQVEDYQPQQVVVAFQRLGFQPDGDPAAFELGKLDSANGDFAAALPRLRRAVSANPHDLDARYALAIALRGQGEQAEAEKEFEYVKTVRQELAKTENLRTSLGTDPTDNETRFQVAMIYLKYQSPKLGIFWLQSVLAQDPRHWGAHDALATYYEKNAARSPSFAELARRHRGLANEILAVPSESTSVVVP